MTIMDDDRHHMLTFSQREGKAPLPEAMELETIPQKFRNIIWRSVDYYFTKKYSGLPEIIESYQFDILSKSHDRITPSIAGNLPLYRHFIMNDEYDKVITFVEYILRNEKCTEDLYDSLLCAFDETPMAYFVEKIEGIPTVVPRTSREAGEATRQAIETLQEGNMNGATTHLRQAAEHLTENQFADSIADSIHAVGSVARLIAPGESNTLSKALTSLEKAGLLKHPALKEAFDKLYGYTSDEQGIRHELLDKSTPNVGRDEAVFMFGACASFAAYLANKHRDLQGGGNR